MGSDSLVGLAGASASVGEKPALLSAADIKEALAAIGVEAKKRGIRVGYVTASVDSFRPHNVHAYISNLGGQDIAASGDDFADAIDNLRAALDSYIPTEQRLALVLGIPYPQAAE